MNNNKWEKIFNIALIVIPMAIGWYGNYLTKSLSVDAKIEKIVSDVQNVNSTLEKYDKSFVIFNDRLEKVLLVLEKSTTRLDYLESNQRSFEQRLSNLEKR